jgi:hypothetical protein
MYERRKANEEEQRQFGVTGLARTKNGIRIDPARPNK